VYINEAQLVALEVVRAVVAQVYTDHTRMDRSLWRQVHINCVRFMSEDSQPGGSRVALDCNAWTSLVHPKETKGYDVRIIAQIPLVKGLDDSSLVPCGDHIFANIDIYDPAPPSLYLVYQDQFRYRGLLFRANVRIIQR
jgi:hypothetical protein